MIFLRFYPLKTLFFGAPTARFDIYFYVFSHKLTQTEQTLKNTALHCCFILWQFPHYVLSWPLCNSLGLWAPENIKSQKKSLLQDSKSPKMSRLRREISCSVKGSTYMPKNTLVLQNYTRDLGFWPDEARADAERKLKCDHPYIEIVI